MLQKKWDRRPRAVKAVNFISGLVNRKKLKEPDVISLQDKIIMNKSMDGICRTELNQQNLP